MELSPQGELYRLMMQALGHSSPGGPHDHRNVQVFLKELDRYIEMKVREGLEKRVTRR
jgi:hypothetical protein